MDDGLMTWLRSLFVITDAGYWLRTVIEIGVLWFMAYALLTFLERTSAGGKIKGIAIAIAAVAGAWMVARLLQLHAISWLLQASIGFAVLALVVVFQPELRRLFTRLGGFFPQGDLGPGTNPVPPLVDAIEYLASRRIGALVVFERKDRLDDFVASSPLDCELTAKLLIALFWKDSPLHDGAVVLRRGRIAGAGVILPLTDSPEFASLSGTRHRAAIGISEDTDALALVVSEETGQISLADRGRLTRNLSAQDVGILLGRMFRAARVEEPAP
jgi:diadenylate cyclase